MAFANNPVIAWKECSNVEISRCAPCLGKIKADWYHQFVMPAQSVCGSITDSFPSLISLTQRPRKMPSSVSYKLWHSSFWLKSSIYASSCSASETEYQAGQYLPNLDLGPNLESDSLQDGKSPDVEAMLRTCARLSQSHTKCFVSFELRSDILQKRFLVLASQYFAEVESPSSFELQKYQSWR